MRRFYRICIFLATLMLCSLAPISAQESEAASCYSSHTVYDPDYAVIGGVGELDWSQDPNSCTPYGDAFRICDTNPDGWGIAVDMANTDRTATTQGHASPYCSGWNTGNLTENTQWTLNVWMVRSGYSSRYAGYITVTA
jgi:hypothetical protein